MYYNYCTIIIEMVVCFLMQLVSSADCSVSDVKIGTLTPSVLPWG